MPVGVFMFSCVTCSLCSVSMETGSSWKNANYDLSGPWDCINSANFELDRNSGPTREFIAPSCLFRLIKLPKGESRCVRASYVCDIDCTCQHFNTLHCARATFYIYAACHAWIGRATTLVHKREIRTSFLWSFVYAWLLGRYAFIFVRHHAWCQ